LKNLQTSLLQKWEDQTFYSFTPAAIQKLKTLTGLTRTFLNITRT